MNKWWFRLYTLPHLKKTGIAFLVALVIITVIHFLTSDLKLLFFSYAALIYPLIIFTTNGESMVKNLDFHSMTIPLRELRKDFYCDLLIQIGCFLLMNLVSHIFILKVLWGPKAYEIVSSFLKAPPSVILFLSFSFITFMLTLRSWIKGTNSSIKDKMFIFMGMAPGLFGSFVDESLRFNPLFALLVLFTTASFITVMDDFCFRFHQSREKNNLKGHVAVLTGSALGSVAIAFICGFMVRFEVNSPFYSSSSKIKMFALYSDFLPVLDVDTTKELLLNQGVDSSTVFQNADPAIFEMPVSEVITNRDLYDYSQYLKYGRPTERNLVYLMRELESHPEAKDWKNAKNKQVFEEVRYRLVQHWPDAKTLPKDLRREVASEKAGR